MAQDALIEQVRGGGQAHRRARVAVPDLLHRICGQDAGGVHRAPIDLVPTKFRHSVAFLERQRRRMPLRSQEGRVSALARVCLQHSEHVATPGPPRRRVTDVVSAAAAGSPRGGMT